MQGPGLAVAGREGPGRGMEVYMERFYMRERAAEAFSAAAEALMGIFESHWAAREGEDRDFHIRQAAAARAIAAAAEVAAVGLVEGWDLTEVLGRFIQDLIENSGRFPVGNVKDVADQAVREALRK